MSALAYSRAYLTHRGCIVVENHRVTIEGRESRHDTSIVLEGEGRKVEDLQSIERNVEVA